MEIISDFSEVCNGTVILCKENEVVIPAYVLNNFNDVYYLYAQNRIVAIEMQHTVENDPITGDLYVITSERRNICTHEDMYELTCIKCGKTISINLADPNYINKND